MRKLLPWTPTEHASCCRPSASGSNARSAGSRTRTTESRRSELDPANLGADLYQDELAEGLQDDLRQQLAALERAEARLAAGTYGLSIESGAPIPDERLEALPTAERTVDEERALQ